MSTGRRALAALIVVFFAAAGGVAYAAPEGESLALRPVTGAAKLRLGRSLVKGTVQTASPAQPETCTNGSSDVTGINCNSTGSGALQTTDCQINPTGNPPDLSYWDAFAFTGAVGQTVTINMTSTAVDAYLFLVRPDGRTDVAQDNNSGGGTNARITFTIDEAGTWYIIANSADVAVAQVGPYTISLTCSGGGGGGGSCVANSTTLCLNNNRFRVTATFLTNAGQSGNATAVPETTDTGMFWFFSANNIEAIIKVVNGCALNSRYWVFAGGLTDVQVVLTVVDTSNGTTRTYTNPQSTAFAPIQDTSAFATCP